MPIPADEWEQLSASMSQVSERQHFSKYADFMLV